MSQPPASLRSAASPGDWRVNLLLFVLTVASVMMMGKQMMIGGGHIEESVATWYSGWPFAVPFLLILLFHEFGHWLAARAHRVPASLPYFLPVPFVLFGTMGAVITMPERIRSRNALLDIGAAGPLAGMVVAIPVLVVGLQLSNIQPARVPGVVVLQEGQSLFYWLVKRMVVGPIPEGYDVFLHPTAFAGWGGLLITMFNLIPWGQLDGGHIAYALLDKRHNLIAPWIRHALLLVFAYNLLDSVLQVQRGQLSMTYWEAIGTGSVWLVWWVLLGVMGRLGGKAHPPCEAGELSPVRRMVAQGCLLLFVLLFMPTPLAYVY